MLYIVNATVGTLAILRLAQLFLRLAYLKCLHTIFNKFMHNREPVQTSLVTYWHHAINGTIAFFTVAVYLLVKHVKFYSLVVSTGNNLHKAMF